MKIVVKIMVLITLGAIISGCNFSNGDVQTAGIGGGSSSSAGGVDIQFVENNPPSEMFKGEEYDFAFLFFNNQMHVVDDLQLKITGFDRGNVVGIPEEDSVSSIPAYSDVAGAGVKTDYFYEGVVVDDFEKEYPFNPKIRYCYSQDSFKKEEIIVPAQNNVVDPDISVDSNSETNGVLGFEILQVNAISDKIRVDFEMTNEGNGRLVDECFEREGFASEFGSIEARLGTEVGECYPTGTEEFIFTNSKANFYCEFGRTGDDSYPSQLFIQAGSLYEQETGLSITVYDPSYGIG